MNDELKNKSGKVKVMYVRSDDDSDKRTQNPRTGKGGGRPASSRQAEIVALVLAAPVIMKRAVVRAPPVAMMPGVRVVRVTIARAVVAAIGTIAGFT